MFADRKCYLKFHRLISILIICGISVMSCQTASPPPSSSPALQQRGPAYGPQLGEIQDRNIPQGQCGLVLWTLQGNVAVPIFKAVTGEEAVMIIDGKPVTFQLDREEGTVSYGVSQMSAYSSNENQHGSAAMTVEIKTPFDLDFERGAYVKDGVMNIKSEKGWERIFPVAGIAGCR